MKIGIVHDWLTGMRGGEKILEVLCELFPDARLYTLLHEPGSVSDTIESMDIRTSFIQRLPFAKKHFRMYLPLFPTAVELLDLQDRDLVISISHCAAKGVIQAPTACHISYVNAPMRYIWDLYSDYFGPERCGLFSRMIIPFFANYLRIWDVTSSARVDQFIANSNHIARRIKRYYRRDSDVIHPPVDVDRFQISNETGDYFLCVSSFAPYKRLDLAVEAFNRMGTLLKVVGEGSEEGRLKRMAGPNIEFLGRLPDAELADCYSRAKALVFPGVEDFGIVPVEAMASGIPVIAYGRGGVLDTVIPLESNPIGFEQGEDSAAQPPTGVFFNEQSVEAIIEAVKRFEKNATLFDAETIRSHSLEFNRNVFKQHIRAYIEATYERHKQGLNS